MKKMTEDIYNRIMSLIRTDRIEDAINELKEVELTDDQKHDLNLCENRLTRFNRETNQGLLNPGEKIERTRIASSFQTLVYQVYNPISPPLSTSESKYDDILLEGTWYTYRHRIDHKEGMLQRSISAKNITRHTVLFKGTEDTNVYDVESKFLRKTFKGKAELNENYIFIRLEEESHKNDKRIVNIHMQIDFQLDDKENNRNKKIYFGIANTYTITDSEEKEHPGLGIPIALKQFSNEVTKIENEIHIPIKGRGLDKTIKKFLEEHPHFASLVPQSEEHIPQQSPGKSIKKYWWFGVFLLLVGCLVPSGLSQIQLWFKPEARDSITVKVYTAIPYEVKFIHQQYAEFAREVREATNNRLIFDFDTTNVFNLKNHNVLLDSVKVKENVAIISIPYYEDNASISQESFLSSLPFGMNSQTFNGWLKHGGGLELLQEHYGSLLHTVPFGCTGNQPFGWFFKEINGIKDLDGLHMRIYGPSGTILKELLGKFYGTKPHSLKTNLSGIPSRDSLASWMNRHNLNFAFEYINPAVDNCIGIYDFAKEHHKTLYLYKNSRHEPHTTYLFFFNKSLWNKLSKDDQGLLNDKLQIFHQRISEKFELEGIATLKRWEKSKPAYIKIRTLDQEIINLMDTVAIDLLNKTKENSKELGFKKIFDSYNTYLKKYENRSLLEE